MSEEKKVLSVSSCSDSGSFRNNKNLCSSFNQGDEFRKPTEIKCSGRYVLSDTENGKSIVFYDSNFIEEDEASELMEHLLEVTDWQMKNITIRGVEYPQPRLVAWYGPFPYSYSGMTLEPAEMPDCILEIKRKVEEYLRKNGMKVILNSVLLNLYRHNKDSVSWHSDDESSMGIFPTIASVSLGDSRRFEMRRKLKYFEDTGYDEYFVSLNNGSILIMDGSMQKDWQHRVPKEHHAKNERINLTFRTVYKVESFLRSLDAPMSLERVTKINRKNISFAKSSTEDFKCSKSEAEDRISGNTDETSQITLKLEDEELSNGKEAEDRISGNTETSRITLKLEDEELSNGKRSNLNDDKNMNKDSSHSSNNATNTDGKNKRLCTNRLSTAANNFKIKSEYTFNAMNNNTSSTFNSCELKDLLKYDVDLMNSKLFLDYANTFKKRVLENIGEFSVPVKYELEILCALTSETQTEENWKIVTKRMYFIVNRAFKMQQDTSKLS